MKEESLVDDTPGIGHNSVPDEATTEELEKYLASVERMTLEKQNISLDIKAVFDNAKGRGFDPATMREMLKLRALDPDVRKEREHLRDTYMIAIGLED